LTFGGKYCIRNLAGVFGNGLELLDGSSVVWRQRRVQIGFLFFLTKTRKNPIVTFTGQGHKSMDSVETKTIVKLNLINLTTTPKLKQRKLN